MVYVLDIKGKPLMPTERHGKVRRLLREGLACVVRLQPFTIQLKYESKRFKQETSLGVDAGSVHIGISATTEKKELFAAEVILRTDIVKKLSNRLEIRRNRRNRSTRYRAARFNNRCRKEGWLAPSIRYKVDSHLKVIRLLHSILPISKTTIEVAQFDIQKIKNNNIQGVEYQKGEQLGFWNIREYVLSRDGHKCQHCKGKSCDNILNVHHIESRKTGGNAPNNLITLCETCHKSYHRGEFDLNVKRGKSLRNAAVMNIMRWAVYEQAKKEFTNVHITYGYVTKHTRVENRIVKSHCADAFCVSGNIKAKRLNTYFKCRCIPRHTRALHMYVPKKGGKRRSDIAPHWIKNSRLQRFDSVVWNGVKCFIFGSTNGRLYLRDIDRNIVTPTAYMSVKKVRFISRNKGMLIQTKIQSLT